MDDWILAGLGAWLGNRWFGSWFKRHPKIAWAFFAIGTALAVAVLTFVD